MIKNGFADQVPQIVYGQIKALELQAERQASEMVVDKILSDIKDSIQVEQMPTREDLEKSFLSKRANPLQIRFDEETDSVYVIGVGLPGREELYTEKIPVPDEKGQKVAEEVLTLNRQEYNTVITYLKVSWSDYKSAVNEVANMAPEIKAGLAGFFDISLNDEHLAAIRLATPGLTADDINGIAIHALAHKATSGNAHSPIISGSSFLG